MTALIDDEMVMLALIVLVIDQHTRVTPITLLPAILFWSNWYFYIAGLLVAFVVLMLCAVIVKPRGAGARKRLMVFAVMRDYLKDQKKTK